MGISGSELLLRAIALFAVLLVAGYILCVLLYRKQGKTFTGSALQAKVMLWIPIFTVFLAFVYASLPSRVVIGAWVLMMMILEAARQYVRAPSHRALVVAYAGLVAASFVHIYMLGSLIGETALLLTIGFASVMSDVTAFFWGNYFGRHALPEQFNASKSWEGLVGQVVGAFIGVALVLLVLGVDIAWWLAIPIGVGAAVGDLANSYVKRQMGIKDWGDRLPGHGGYLDRFASLSGSIVLTYYALIINGVL